MIGFHGATCDRLTLVYHINYGKLRIKKICAAMTSYVPAFCNNEKNVQVKLVSTCTLDDPSLKRISSQQEKRQQVNAETDQCQLVEKGDCEIGKYVDEEFGKPAIRHSVNKGEGYDPDKQETTEQPKPVKH